MVQNSYAVKTGKGVTVRKYGVFICFAIAVLGSAGAEAECPGSQLVNGQTADAVQVMNWLNCKAPLENPSFTGTISTSGAIYGANISPNNPVSLGSILNVNRIDSAGPAGMRFRFINTGYGIDGIDIASFGHNGVLSATVGSDGSLLLGTASSGGWTGNAKLEALTATVGISGYNNASTGDAFRARVDYTGAVFMDMFYGNTFLGSINTDGTQVIYGGTSDARLKVIDAIQPDLAGTIRSLWVGSFENGGISRTPGHISRASAYWRNRPIVSFRSAFAVPRSPNPKAKKRPGPHPASHMLISPYGA